MMKKPNIGGDSPKEVSLQEGKSYAWCGCGLSGTQPFCDGSHKSTDFKPKVFKSAKNEDAWLCRCKQTKNPPYCDGSHNSL